MTAANTHTLAQAQGLPQMDALSPNDAFAVVLFEENAAATSVVWNDNDPKYDPK